ncbi:MAG: transporter substrate-binding domain-containing protein [Oscillospiraceae bacterium]
MKKLLAMILALVLALSLVACGSKPAETPAAPENEKPAEATTAKLDAIKASGKLILGTEAFFGPYEFHTTVDGKDKIVGFDIDIAQAIADELGVELEIKDMAFDSLIMELQAGTVDLVIAGLSPDPERAEAVDFSDIYYQGGQSFVINAKNVDKYKSYSDFDGLSVAAQAGSIQANLLKENTPKAQEVLLATNPDIFLELSTGKVEGAYIETIILQTWAKNYPELVEMCPVEYDVEGSAVAVGKGNSDLLELVNRVIKNLTDSGKIDEFVDAAAKLYDPTAE